MFNFFANIFGYILNFIYNIVQNYGVAIIIFTVLLKICMLPINIKQQRTMKKSAKLQKKVKELQEKYSKDTMKLNQEMMDLYKSENMSPFSGCLSSIVQMVIIISIFFLVSRPLTFMLHVDSELINNYIKEIQDNSSERVNYQEIAVIREKSSQDERVKLNMDFLGLDLSSIPSQNYSDWKVFVIPVLYVVTSIISMRVTTNMQGAGNKENDNIKAEDKNNDIDKEKSEKQDDVADTMEEMNKSMRYMTPIMSVSISLIAPLGLALYWFVNNLLMIIERLAINKFFKDSEE